MEYQRAIKPDGPSYLYIEQRGAILHHHVAMETQNQLILKSLHEHNQRRRTAPLQSKEEVASSLPEVC